MTKQPDPVGGPGRLREDQGHLGLGSSQLSAAGWLSEVLAEDRDGTSGARVTFPVARAQPHTVRQRHDAVDLAGAAPNDHGVTL